MVTIISTSCITTAISHNVVIVTIYVRMYVCIYIYRLHTKMYIHICPVHREIHASKVAERPRTVETVTFSQTVFIRQAKTVMSWSLHFQFGFKKVHTRAWLRNEKGRLRQRRHVH